MRKINAPPCAVTHNVVTEPYKLAEKFKHIIHAVNSDCRRPNQDEARRELLAQTYDHLFERLEKWTMLTQYMLQFVMGTFAYPHREGARLTLEVLLGKMDGEEDPKIKEYNIVVKEKNLSAT